MAALSLDGQSQLRDRVGDEAALKVKPCETIEIVPLRERAERRPALSHSRHSRA
jgi:hypothetical protein